MFLFSRPDPKTIQEFIGSNIEAGFSYPNQGGTKFDDQDGRLDRDYTVDHNRIIVGKGEIDFEMAKNAIRNWKMFDLEWLDLCWKTTPIEENRIVAILIRHFGFYSLNAARILYVIDDPHRFGFAYGTLAEHAESGEERFSVDFDERTGDVCYDILAFSRPRHWLARLGYPLTRRLQKQFAKDSMAAILRAILP